MRCNKNKKAINCKGGLTPEQEIKAREIKRRLSEKADCRDIFQRIEDIFDQYDYSKTFVEYLEQVDPILASACKRANIGFSIIDKKIIIERM